MSTVLIVGASQGLGLEWVKYYKNRGDNVIATTRDINSAVELKSLLKADNDQILQVDVTSIDSVTSAMSQMSQVPDITIYNAGVKGYSKIPNTTATLLNAKLINGDTSSREAGRELAFQVNAHGFDRIMYALKDKLLTKPKAAVVYVSTGVADTTQNTSGGYPFYRQSKTAGEAYVREWELDLRQGATFETSSPRIFSIIPGLVNTGMGAGIKDAADPAKRVAEMVAVIERVILTGDTHGVWKYDGTKHVEYELPDCIIKSFGTDRDSTVKILARRGFYVTKKIVTDQSQPAELKSTSICDSSL